MKKTISGLLRDNHKSGSLRGIRLLKPYTWWLALVVGILFVLTFVDMAAPYFLKLLVDDVFPNSSGGGGNVRLLWLILPGMVVSYVARNALFYASRMQSLHISEDLCFDLRRRLYDHLQHLSLSFYHVHQPGRLSARLMDDTFKIQSFIQDKLPLLIRYLLEFQILLIIIYLMNWRLAIASTIVLPLHLVTSRYFRDSIRRSHSEAQENLARAHGNVVEKFLGMEVVKGFGAEERESQAFQEAINASRRSQIRSQRYDFTQKVIADLLVGLGTVVLLGYGTWNVLTGHMRSGEFLMFFLYVRMLYPDVLEIISGVGHLSRAMANVDRVFEMLAEPTGDTGGDGEASVAMTGHIEYRHVCLSYGPDSTPVLNDVSFTIRPGEHVAVIGPSGSGKTTLVSLLPRFNDPSSGQILIDGRPSDTIPIPELRGLFGIVFQEVFLFNTSIYENLRYARPDASLEEVMEACKITGAHDFIQRLPKGYYTKIGGAGSVLSRGERQRITLARALIRNPRVLIIDEATASIDNSAASEIIQSILRRMEGRTVIMVTHDIELLHLVERMICIEGGTVAYDGVPQISRPADSRAGTGTSMATSPAVRIDPVQSAAERSRSHIVKALKTGLGPIAGMLMLPLLLSGGCISSTKTERAVDVNQPRVAGGAIIEADDPNQLKKIGEALDKIALNPPSIPSPGGPNVPPAAVADPNKSAAKKAPEPPRIGTAQAVGMAGVPGVPADATRLISLPKLSSMEINEMCDRLELKLRTELGYRPATGLVSDALPTPPEGMTEDKVLMRPGEAGTHVLRIGFRQFISQPPQCWTQGLILGDKGTLAANPDLAKVEPAVTEMIAAMNQMRTGLTVRDLQTKLIQLSYVNVDTALVLLQAMGMTTIAKPADVPQAVDFAKLPYVIMMPDPVAADVGLIGAKTSAQESQWGLSLTPGVASDITANAVASPMTQLMVMFHPAHPEQFSRVRQALDLYIDRPARQIFIEGMVLEISEDGLKDLGISWDLDQGPLSINTAGTLRAGGSTDTLSIFTPDTSRLNNIFEHNEFQWNWAVRLRALIQTGKAEVLSRPSVLTLDNRQSTIRVGQDIPIASSYEGVYSSSNKVNFSFKYLPTGILLNIRPRINESATEVSMLIDTVVSAKVPNADLTLRSADGITLASAPTVSTRRVQTYGRIRNNTPFIIGGLVSREQTVTMNKIPFLGDLPWIGAAFRAERNEMAKTEVIIVLTPYVLPEKDLVPRLLPKDEDLFDNFGNKLFRDSYRIRAEDVFDLSFLLENPRIVNYRDLARRAVEKDFRLARSEPFRSFVRDSVPGEPILVTRMIYEVVKRLNLAEPVQTPRIIYLEGQQVGGYNVDFLESLLRDETGERFKDLGDKALAIIFHRNGDSNDAERLGREPIPEIRMVDCPDRETWNRKLWELNQPTDGRENYAILIQNDSDILRLRRALVLKKIVVLNGGVDQMRLANFSMGKVLLMPEMKPDQIHLIDSDAAMFFFYTEHYYAATLARIETQLKQLDEKLRSPEVRVLVETPDP